MTVNPLQGVLMVLLAAVCWGTTGTAQSFVPPSLPAYWVGALRPAEFSARLDALGVERR